MKTKRRRYEPPKPRPKIIDRVEEASEESFPASDSPSWTPVVGEKSSTPQRNPAKNNPSEAKANTKGCATSFLMDERGEIGGICGDVQPQAGEQYVQPDKEKEAGGEG